MTRTSLLLFLIMNVLLSFGQRKEESKVYVFPYKYSKVMKNQDESAGVFVNGTQLTGVNTDQIIEYTTFSSGKLYVGIRYFDAYRTIGVDVDGSEPTCVGIIVDSEPSFMGVRYSLSLVQVSFDTMMMQLAKIKGGYSKKDFDENDIALQVNGKSIGKPVTDGNGTGFFITSTGLIITNHHVIENASKIFVRGINGNLNEKWEAEIIAMDDTNDLAILNIKDTTFTPTLSFAVRANAVETGEDVFALGYPMTTSLGKEIKLTNGIISAESGYKDDNTSFQISAPVQKGNSGSPVFDKGGNLVGVITSKVHSAENVAYAVKNDALDRLLTKVVDPSTLNQVNSLEGLPLNEQVKKIRKGVLLIEISKKFIDK